MKLQETKINTGGLFRCCVETINKLSEDKEYNNGDIIVCEYEKNSGVHFPTRMMLKDGVWSYLPLNVLKEWKYDNEC